jgi:hypothetical protein
MTTFSCIWAIVLLLCNVLYVASVGQDEERSQDPPASCARVPDEAKRDCGALHITFFALFSRFSAV